MDLRGLQGNGEIWLDARLKKEKKKNLEVFLFVQPLLTGRRQILWLSRKLQAQTINYGAKKYGQKIVVGRERNVDSSHEIAATVNRESE